MGDSTASAPAAAGDGLEAALRAAQALAESRNYAAAIVQLRQALSQDPDCVRAHYLLGLYLYLIGKRGEALQPCRAGIALGPNDAVAHRVIGVILGTHRGDRRKGLEHLRTAVALAPEDGLNHYFLGRALSGLGRNRPADASFRTACARSPADPTILAGYAEFLHIIGRRKAARDLAARALTLAPDDYQVLTVNAQVALRDGRTAAARDFAIAALGFYATFAPAVEVLVEADMRRNPVFALWSRWRGYTKGRPNRASLLLFGLWFGCNVGILACAAIHPSLSQLPVFGFGAFLVILWVAPRVFWRRVRRELREVKLNENF